MTNSGIKTLSASDGANDNRPPVNSCITTSEAAMLKTNPLLEEAVLSGGVIDLIALVRTTVTELSTANPKLWSVLRDGSIQEAVKQEVISMRHLLSLSTDKLTEALEFLRKEQPERAAAALGLNRIQSDRLCQIVKANFNELSQELRLS